MPRRPPGPPPPGTGFFESYTAGLTAEDLQRLFTRDAREAYQFFARGIDTRALAAMPWHRRVTTQTRLLFWAFTLTLSPPRRAIYGISLVAMVLGLLKLWRGFVVAHVPLFAGIFIPVPVPMIRFEEGTTWVLIAFVAVNLILMLELADRLSLKNDLEIAREIQQAMLPRAPYVATGVEAFGLTRPANTVGGDFYDILPLEDGRVAIAVGDVAGKGSPAALLMALLLAILRTLVDERLGLAALMTRLNAQVIRHAPRSRFVTLLYGVYDPSTGLLTYVNAGHLPPVVRRADGAIERLTEGGIALGMFDYSEYQTGQVFLQPGDRVVLYSDGVTEAENPTGTPFEDAGLEAVLAAHPDADPDALCGAIVSAVERYAADRRLADDVTLLVLQRRPVA
jgi:sigma-B regulation protein RsbU (phosphoserine phosphatase)